MAKAEMQDAVVALRKSVDVDGTIYGPGSTVTLPAADVSALRIKGFLVDPSAGDFAGDGSAPSVSITGGGEAGA